MSIMLCLIVYSLFALADAWISYTEHSVTKLVFSLIWAFLAGRAFALL